MAITEERLNQILDNKLIRFREDIEKKLTSFRADIVADIHKDMLKETNVISDKLNSIKTSISNSNKKIKACEERISALEKADSPFLKDMTQRIVKLEKDIPDIPSLNRMSEDYDSLKSTCDVLSEKLTTLTAQYEKQTEEIEDTRNRSMRSTLVFKGLNLLENELSWDDTEKHLMKTIKQVDNTINDGAIDRCHRGHQKKDNSHPPDIVAKFHSWKTADKVKRAMSEKGMKDKSFKIYCNQKYGPLTTARRNMAMVERRKIISEGVAAKAYVAFPAKLMIAKDKKDKKYSLHKDFSNSKIVSVDTQPKSD